MRLVFVTQRVDAADPILGATVAKLRALAARVDSLHVLALSAREGELPANVTVQTFGAPTRLRRTARYLHLVAPALARRPDALLAHMCPIYLVLAAPLAKPLRVPLALWYTHWTVNRELRAATRLCDLALTVDRASFPLDSPKVRAIGHGIDLTDFAPGEPRTGEGPLRLLALGRTSPSKGFATLLDALEQAVAGGLDATLALHGPATTAEERAHREELLRRVASGPLAGRVRVEEAVPRPDVPALLRDADALVNPRRAPTRGEALDKVVYEAAACGLPVLACNPSLAEPLGRTGLRLFFREGDAADLADAMRALGDAGPEQRARAGGELRRWVEESHSAEGWADAVVASVAGLRGR